MTNLIIDDLPVTFNGFAFNADFKAVLRLLTIIQDEEKNENEKALSIGRVFFNGVVPESEHLWDFISSFILRKGLDDDDNENYDSGEKNFDFFVDAGLIYSSFMQAYNIDLRSETLHWWLFVQLLEDLPDDAALKKVIHIRQEKPKKENGREYNAYLARMKDKYRLYTPSISSFFGD